MIAVFVCWCYDFYPRPHMEGDQQVKTVGSCLQIFLPTPSHGGRQWRNQAKNRPYHFYPRPHMEGDLLGDKIDRQGGFLPTPSHGGRPPSFRRHQSHIRISTHALTWRATTAAINTWKEKMISTHALTWRATCSRLTGLLTCFKFLPTPSHGGRLWRGITSPPSV